jgi:hypothetical protein
MRHFFTRRLNMHPKKFILAGLVFSLQAAAQTTAVPANITALRSQVEQDNSTIRQLAKQLTDTQSVPLQQNYVVARLKLDQDVIALRQAAEPLLASSEANLRQLYAQAEAAQIAGDSQTASTLRTQYRQQEANFKTYRATLTGDF